MLATHFRSLYLHAVIPAFFMLTLAACSSNESSSADPTDPQAGITGLSWTNCEDTPAVFECAKLQVPMNHSEPEGEQIDLALIRHVATGAQRLGSLFVNFGGASGSGVEDVQLIIEENILPNSVLSSYDIVGFDPRGAGGSTPVDCSDVTQIEFNPYPLNVSDIELHHAEYSAFSAACEAKYGEYLHYLGSINTVHDMEQIRIALGDEKTNMLAYSFSSRVAALYLQEYPESSGRMVLDGGVGPDSSLRIVLSAPLPLAQATLLSIIAECKSTDDSCDPDALIDGLATRLNTLAASNDDSSKDEFAFVFDILTAFVEFSEEARRFSPLLVDYIQTMDVSMLLASFGSGDDGEENTDNVEGDDGLTVETASLCADDAFRPTVNNLITALDEFNQRSDIFAENALSEYSRCAGWPEAIAPPAPIVTNTAPVSIVIGGINDPIAPIALSEDMANAIGGFLIKSDHPGHISAFLGKSACVDNAVEAFLLQGTTPAEQNCFR